MEGIQSIIRGGGLGTPTKQLPLQHRTSLPELRSKLLGVLRLEFFFLKRCEDVGMLTLGSTWWGMTSRWLMAVA
jgi:hypothetical protein